MVLRISIYRKYMIIYSLQKLYLFVYFDSYRCSQYALVLKGQTKFKTFNKTNKQTITILFLRITLVTIKIKTVILFSSLSTMHMTLF